MKTIRTLSSHSAVEPARSAQLIPRLDQAAPGVDRFRRSTLTVAVLAALFPEMPALAQNDKLVLEEVLVTATKRTLNLQDVPQSITAFTTDDIEKMGIKNMSDYIRALPSVSVQATTPGRNQIVMRGISTGSDEYRVDSQVAVYLDEQPMTTNSQQIGVRTIDMERIENLPGPQGTLFGSSSQTGTLRLITNKPSFEALGGQIEGAYGVTEGGDDSYDINGFLNVPLIDDVLAMRVVAYNSNDGGYVDNVYGRSLKGNYDNADVVEEDFNEYETKGGRLSVLWNINENWSGLFNLVGEENNADGTWESDPYLGDYKISRFIDEYRDDEWYSAAFTLKGDIGGFAELTASVAHLDRDIAYEWDNMTYAHSKDRVYGGGLYYEQYYAGNPYYYNYANLGLYDAEYIPSTIVNDQHQERDSIEIRLASTSDSKLQWMIGGYYEKVDDDWFYYTKQPELTDTRAFSTAQAYAYYYSQYYDNVQYPLPDTDIGYSNTLDRTVEQLAFFGELSYDITEKLTLTGGARWAEFDRDENDIYQFPQGLAPAGGHDTGGEYGDSGKDDDIIYKFSAQYEIDDDRMVYFLFSQGFRLGGVNSQRAANTGAVPRTYDPDYLDNYEIGLKSQWFENRLQLNVSAFYMEWDDYQVDASGFGPWWVQGKDNGEGAETLGMEVSTTWQISERLSFTGSAFVADAEFSGDYTFPDGDMLEDGSSMPGSPDGKAWLGVDYTIPGVLGGDFWFHYDISYEAEKWNNIDNIIDNNKDGLADEWYWSNLQMGLDLENNLHFTFRVDNVWDQQTYGWVDTGGNGDADVFNDPRFHNTRSLDRPRTAWLTVRKGF